MYRQIKWKPVPLNKIFTYKSVPLWIRTFCELNNIELEVRSK